MADLLVVEDDEAVRSAVGRILREAGHSVAVAEDGAAALSHFESQPVDLIVTDVYMPDMDGVEFLIRLGQLETTVPVVVISGGGWASAGDVLERARALGAAATIEKPFDPDGLIGVVEAVLERSGKTST